MWRRARSVLRPHAHTDSLSTLVSAGFASAAAKAAKSGKGGAADKTAKQGREEGAKDKRHQTLLGALTPADVSRLVLSPEEQAEHSSRAKEYSRMKMAEHRVWQKGLVRKLQHKKAALAALPDYLRTAALVMDWTPFPADRLIPTHTPPIPGYSERRSAGGKGKGKSGG